MENSNKILMYTIAVLLVLFFIIMIGITLDFFIHKDELKTFIAALASGISAVILIPIAEIEKEHTPRWYEDIV